jgi:hypothetical protein
MMAKTIRQVRTSPITGEKTSRRVAADPELRSTEDRQWLDSGIERDELVELMEDVVGVL